MWKFLKERIVSYWIKDNINNNEFFYVKFTKILHDLKFVAEMSSRVGNEEPKPKS